MNTRQRIRNDLNALLFTTAETYNNLIPDDISEEDLTGIAKTIESARQVAEDSLFGMTQDLVEETTVAVKAAVAKKKDRLSQLIPTDIPQGVEPVWSPPPVLEGPAVSPPRVITEVRESLPGPTMSELTEAAARVDTSRAETAGVVDMDFSDGDDYSHNLETPLAQQKKKELGIPTTNKEVKTFGVYSQAQLAKMSGQPITAALSVSNSGERQALQTIRALVLPFSNADDKTLAMLSTSILAVIEPVLGPVENFTRPQGGNHG